MLRTCEICGIEFSSKRAAKTCGDECLNQRTRLLQQARRRGLKVPGGCVKTELVCVVCGNTFLGSVNTVTCSDVCRKERNDQHRKKYAQSAKGKANKKKYRIEQGYTDAARAYNRKYSQNARMKEYAKERSKQFKSRQPKYYKAYAKEYRYKATAIEKKALREHFGTSKVDESAKRIFALAQCCKRGNLTTETIEHIIKGETSYAYHRKRN